MLNASVRLFRLSIKMNRRPILVATGVAVLLEVLAVCGLYGLNQVRGMLYGGIQNYDADAIWRAIAYFCGLAGILVLINGWLGFYINRLAFEIRRGLTHFELTYPEISFVTDETIQNYPQRVQEDIRKFGETFCELWAAILKSVLRLPVFVGVLITLTNWYAGALVILAVVAGTVATRLAARALVYDQVLQESNEANFRSYLTLHTFNVVAAQFERLNKLFKRLSFVQSGLGQAFVLLPFILLMPLYISKAIAMNAFFQSVDALNKVIDSLTVLIDSRQVIVNMDTSIARLSWLVRGQ